MFNISHVLKCISLMSYLISIKNVFIHLCAALRRIEPYGSLSFYSTNLIKCITIVFIYSYFKCFKMFYYTWEYSQRCFFSEFNGSYFYIQPSYYFYVVIKTKVTTFVIFIFVLKTKLSKFIPPP